MADMMTYEEEIGPGLIADAVLKAMSEPTYAMIDAGSKIGVVDEDAKRIFRAMIDEASK